MVDINLTNKTILVVEDDDRCWLLLREIIEVSNGIAIWSDSGMKAIDIVKSATKIDLILMDMHLPIMGGLETTKKIKELKPWLPIIAQTAYAEPTFLNDCLEAGCISYILKPFETNDLCQLLQKALFETH